MTTSSSSFDHRSAVRHVWLSVILSVAIIGIAWLIVTIQRQQQGQRVTTRSIILSTPESFHDAIGVIKQINGQTLSVDVVTTDAQGQLRHRTYVVSADNNTTIEQLKGSTLTPLTFNQLSVNDHVQVAADLNLATIDHFTATKIFQLTSS